MKCYIYCTKAKPYLYRIDDDNKFELRNKKTYSDAIDDFNFVKDYHEQNGKIIASFDLDEVSSFYADDVKFFDELLKESCLTNEEVSNYLKDKKGYGWNIKNLEIFDKPMNLWDFETTGMSCNMGDVVEKGPYDYYVECSFKLCKHNYEGSTCNNYSKTITKAPQSWQYALTKDFKRVVLISIKSEWVCKILNGEKTIEIKKTYPLIY